MRLQGTEVKDFKFQCVVGSWEHMHLLLCILRIIMKTFLFLNKHTHQDRIMFLAIYNNR